MYFFILEYNTNINLHLQSLCSFSDDEKERIMHIYLHKQNSEGQH